MITLSSDFGAPYPAAMRGVILQTSDARLVDVSHSFPRQDVRGAAFWLREILPYFPPAVHLIVVDPGVGTDRDAVVLRAGEHALVGPDNGVLRPAARALAAGADIDRFRVRTRPGTAAGRGGTTWPPARASATFHGRDVFAPAAARVHDREGPLAEDPGFEPIDELVDLSLPTPTIDGNAATGEVLVVDGFGNAITNVPGRALDGVERVAVRSAGGVERVVPAVETFEAVAPGEALATVGSHGNVELGVNRGRGDEAFGLSAGDGLTVVFDP